MNQAPGNNPLDMLQGMWNQMGFQLPGMVTPTLDEGELDKQIRDLKSVENWLRMNLSMLQMTIQNLEMQKSALGTFRSMSAHFSHAASGDGDPSTAPSSAPAGNPFFQAAGFNPAPPSAPEPTAAPEGASGEHDEAALAKAAMWPWEMMNELNATMQAQMADANRQKTRAKEAAKKSAAKKPSAKRPAAKKKL